MPALPRILALFSLCLATACSTVVEGTTQKVTVSSTPQGAQCLIKQADDVVGRITTPGTAEVPKNKNDLVILCSKEGYESVSVKNRSEMALTSLGNLAFYELSFVGDAVDSMSGASNKYDSKVFVRLTPAAEPAVFPVPPNLMPMPQLRPVPQMVPQMSIQPPMPQTNLTPYAPASVAAPATPSGSNPSLRASESLARAALKLAEAENPTPLTYAQQVAELPLRPPFDLQ